MDRDNDTILQQIERYLDGKLSEQEHISFEARLEKEPELMAQLTSYQTALEAIELDGELQLKQQLRQRYLDTPIEEAAPVKSLRSRNWWLMAAAIALILVGTIFFQNFSFNQTASGSELYAMYYEQMPLSMNRDVSSSYQQFEYANQLYNEGKFEESLTLLDSVLQDSSFTRQDYAWLHKGLAQMGLGQFEVAEKSFEHIPASSVHIHRATWFRALAFLKAEQVNAARPLLQALIANSKEYGMKAQEILSKLPKSD